MVAELLGREPMGSFTVVLRRDDGSPVVLENAPLQASGRPMPTRFWLADTALNREIGRLEATGGVKQAEAAIGLDAIARVHARYERDRDRLIPPDHNGPRPSWGVGGTRTGVKCLHAHYAYYLAGGQDPVGEWVHDRLAARGVAFDPCQPGIATARSERA